MKAYVLSLIVGLGVGVLYSISGVRSPAPPLVALLGLAGILLGEAVCNYLLRGGAVSR